MGDEITICTVLNKHDDLYMTLFTEWSNSSFKITIFSTGDTPLAGQMKDAEINTFANSLHKTRDEYLHAVRDFLSGKDKSIEVYLKDSKLRWKKGIWSQGIVNVEPVPLSTVFPGILKQFLSHDEKLNTAIQSLQHENEELKETQKLLKEKLESMIDIKESIEDELYKKFISILNTKKEKIRELEAELQKKTLSSSNYDKFKPFEASTDDSEISENEEVDKSKDRHVLSFNGRGKRNKLLKRQIEYDEEKMIDSEFEGDGDGKSKRNCKYQNAKLTHEINIDKDKKLSINRPSTSKSNDNLSSILIEDSKQRKENDAVNSEIVKTVSQLDFTSNESEEDLFK